MNRIFQKSRLTLLLGFATLSLLMVGCMPSQNQSEEFASPTPVNSFLTKQVKFEDVHKQIILRGKASPINKLTIVSEVQGKASYANKPLKAGQNFKKGELLIQVDNTDSKLNLLSSKSKLIALFNQMMSTIKLDYPGEFHHWQNYVLKIDEELSLPKLPKTENQNLKNYLLTNGVFDLYYSIKRQENQLSKFHIYAPYDGAITKSFVNDGDMLMPNKALAEYSATYEYEVEAAVSIIDLNHIKIGQNILLKSRETEEAFTGTITRINRKLDSQTQMASVYISVKNKWVTEGMFLEGNVSIDIQQKGFAFNRKLLRRNNEVHVIRDSVVTLVPVEILIKQDNDVYVTGLKENDLIVNEVVNYPIIGIKAISKN